VTRLLDNFYTTIFPSVNLLIADKAQPSPRITARQRPTEPKHGWPGATRLKTPKTA